MSISFHIIEWGQTRLAARVFADEFGKYKTDSLKNIAGGKKPLD